MQNVYPENEVVNKLKEITPLPTTKTEDKEEVKDKEKIITPKIDTEPKKKKGFFLFRIFKRKNRSGN